MHCIKGMKFFGVFFQFAAHCSLRIQRLQHILENLENPSTVDVGFVTNILFQESIIQIYYSGITRGRVLNGKLYAQRLQKYIYLHNLSAFDSLT